MTAAFTFVCALILYVDINNDNVIDAQLNAGLFSYEEFCEERGEKYLTNPPKFGKVIKYKCIALPRAEW